MRGRMLEDYVARNLFRLVPNLRLVSRHKRIPERKSVDLYAKDEVGREYYIEVKDSDCNRLNIGQAVEYKATLTKVNPEAKLVLVCRSADESIKQTLRKLGIEIRTFADLRITGELAKEYGPSKSLALKMSPTEQRAYFALVRKGFSVARADDLASTISISKQWAKNILSSLANQGVAYRIGRGKYAIIPADVLYGRKSFVADPLVVTSELMKDKEYYVAYQSAAHIHGIAEQVPFTSTVAVLKQRRSVKLGNAKIEFVTLKKSRFFGFKKMKYSNAFLRVSDLEKTAIDCIDRQDLCGGISEVFRTISNAIAVDNLDQARLLLYAEKFRSHALAQRLGFLLEQLAKTGKAQVDQNILRSLERLAGSYIYRLDTNATKRGKVSERWRIIENVSLAPTKACARASIARVP